MLFSSLLCDPVKQAARLRVEDLVDGVAEAHGHESAKRQRRVQGDHIIIKLKKGGIVVVFLKRIFDQFSYGGGGGAACVHILCPRSLG